LGGGRRGEGGRTPGWARESEAAVKHKREELIGQAVRAERSEARQPGVDFVLFIYLFRRAACKAVR
jgi:hypothetical protein